MNLPYLLSRLARRFAPSGLAQGLLRKGIIIKPGLETTDPQAAFEKYRSTLADLGSSLSDKRILVFGYGGNFAIGCHLLRHGAAHVVLCDKDVRPDDRRNRTLLEHFGEYLLESDSGVEPNSSHATIFQGDIREAQAEDLMPVDLVLSNSVFEHLDEVESITHALANLTAPQGMHLHFIDLRDHFFKYPFEMLTFSDRVWLRWLNPSSNLNRYRVRDYEGVFQKHFDVVEVKILDRDELAFRKTHTRIRPEFLSGEPEKNSATIIQVVARSPR